MTMTDKKSEKMSDNPKKAVGQWISYFKLFLFLQKRQQRPPKMK